METIFAPTNQLARATGLAIDAQTAFYTHSVDALFTAGMAAAEQQFDSLRTYFASATVDFAGRHRQWLGAGILGWEATPAMYYPSHGKIPQSPPIGMALASVSPSELCPELAVDSGGLVR